MAWKLSDDDRAKIMDMLIEMATDPEGRARNKITAVKAIQSADRLNLAQEALELERRRLEGGTDTNNLILVAAKIGRLQGHDDPASDDSPLHLE